MLITKYGEVKDSVYLDPIGKQLIFYNHIKQEPCGSWPITDELPGNVEPLRYKGEGGEKRIREEDRRRG